VSSQNPPKQNLGFSNSSVKKARRRRGRDDGFYTILFVLMLPLIVGSIGLGVDVSHFNLVRGQLQNAADSAAFAGAASLNSTSTGRTAATTNALTYAQQHRADRINLTAAEVIENQTGHWDFDTNTFTTTNVTDVHANAIRVSVQRQNVPSFFSPLLSGAVTAQTLNATTTAVAGGARQIGCGFPVAIATCALTYDSAGKLNCPTNLSFQNGIQSVGLTLPDGSSPVNGNKAKPYIKNALGGGCNQGVGVGDELYLQNGNDLTQESVDDINAATSNGSSPKTIYLPVVDLSCGGGGPTYNQSAEVVGFLKMKVVGARWTDTAPPAVAAACPTIGKKNLCVTADCGMIDSAPGGGTINVTASKTYLVR